MKPIFLVGYMGSGKTTIGKLVAKQCGYHFVDMDAEIEAQQGKTVSQIFAEQGEQQFRLLEQKCLYELAKLKNVIISTGGGTPCFFDNMEFMNAHGLTIYLHFSAYELAERLEVIGVSKRPILADKTSEELRSFISNALAVREPYYSLANLSVSGEIMDTVRKINSYLSRH
jgi:shikimate kinase